MDVLQAYVRDADLFRDHAGAGLLRGPQKRGAKSTKGETRGKRTRSRAVDHSSELSHAPLGELGPRKR
jgi:hypothetical protein